jgi:UDP-glucose 6-dehydrogenase
MNIGIVGHGFVGRAIRAWFERTHAVFVYDKAEHPESALAALAAAADLIFVAVPTPMAPDGSCHTGIVDGALVMLARALNRVGRRPVVVLKSTVTPGYTALARETTGLRLVFSPEFLTERSSEQDFATINRVIVGGPIDDATVVFEAFERSGTPARSSRTASPTRRSWQSCSRTPGS